MYYTLFKHQATIKSMKIAQKKTNEQKNKTKTRPILNWIEMNWNKSSAWNMLSIPFKLQAYENRLTISFTTEKQFEKSYLIFGHQAYKT